MGKILNSILMVFALNAGIFASEIHDAAQSGDLVRLQSLLEGNPELLEFKDSLGTTPLLSAVSAGQAEIVEFLIKSGADIKVSNNRGSTALHLAAFGGFAPLVEFFLDQGLGIDLANTAGNTPLLLACMRGQVEAAKILIEKGADLTIQDGRWGGAAIHWACRLDSNGIRDLLAKGGADLNTRSRVDNSTPMAWAIFNEKRTAVEFLIARGVDVNESFGGFLPLNMAIGGGHQEIARFLLENGARGDATDSSGQTPLQVAVGGGDTTLAELLLQEGINVNQPDSSGMTPLHWAALRDHQRLVELLLAHGANIEAKDNTGKTPLIWAGRNTADSAALALLNAGADINGADIDGTTPLLAALTEGNGNLARLYLKRGADIHVRDKTFGRNALHWSALYGFGEVTTHLINKGIDINALDTAGQTPLYYAEKYGHSDLSDIIRKHGGTTNSRIVRPEKAQENSIRQGEAIIWYTGHCGFAIKTANHLLILDYFNPGTPPDQPSLANGHINLSELAGENVTVFVTHEHQDHFDPRIFQWIDSIPGLTYILGFRPENLPQYRDSGFTGPAYEYLAPHDSRKIGDMKVTTIAANDAGVGFLVEVDGLTIYHAGDHAGWRPGQRDGFIAEIEFIAENIPAIDVAFLNATGCHVQDTIALQESIQYTLNKLNPGCWFPTHATSRESVLKNMAARVAAAGCMSPAVCVENRGDKYILRNGKVLPL